MADMMKRQLAAKVKLAQKTSDQAKAISQARYAHQAEAERQAAERAEQEAERKAVMNLAASEARARGHQAAGSDDPLHYIVTHLDALAAEVAAIKKQLAK